MNKFVIISAMALCLVSQCVLGQYQTAPAYGGGGGKQRKMAPAPQSYGMQQQQQEAGDYDQSSMDEQSKYGGSPSGASAGYGKQMGAKQMGVYGKMSQSTSYGTQMSGQTGGQAGGYGGQPAGQSSSYGGQMGGQSSGYGGQMGGQSSGYGSQSAGYGEEQKYPPMPYDFGYNIDDGYQNTQYRKESADEQGKVTGSYGYRDSYGVFRYVDYVADENGFRASLRSNEPGLGKEAPADVEWQVEDPPAQTNPGSKSSYGSGASPSSYGKGGAEMSEMSQYGAGSAAMSMGGQGKYGSQSGAPSYGSGGSDSQYGNGDSSMNGGKRYGATSNSKSGQSAYGMMSAGQQGAQYGMGGAGKSSGYGAMGARGGAMRSAYGTGSSDSGADQYAMAGGEQYGAQQMSMGQDEGQYNSDSALAQQYGPASMSMAGGKGQQYGNGAMDGASTYSSTRLQPGARGSSYPMMSMAGGAQRSTGSGYGAASKMSMAMQPSGAMDYKKAAAKNIAALVKRY